MTDRIVSYSDLDLSRSRVASMRRKPDPIDLADEYTAESLVPPIPVLVIDTLLATQRGDGLVDKHRVVDMLLDIRNAIWTPNDYSAAIAPLLDKQVESKHDLRPGVRPAAS